MMYADFRRLFRWFHVPHSTLLFASMYPILSDVVAAHTPSYFRLKSQKENVAAAILRLFLLIAVIIGDLVDRLSSVRTMDELHAVLTGAAPVARQNPTAAAMAVSCTWVTAISTPTGVLSVFCFFPPVFNVISSLVQNMSKHGHPHYLRTLDRYNVGPNGFL